MDEDLYEDPYDPDCEEDEDQEEERRKKELDDDLAMAAVIMDTEVFHPVTEQRFGCMVLIMALLMLGVFLICCSHFLP